MSEELVSDLGEREIVRRIRGRIPGGPGVSLGVGDDTAAVETGPLTLVTSDALVEGVHFKLEWSPPRLVGRKALSVNLSDVAAMAGVPRFATVSLALPPATPWSFVDGLYDGLLERAAEAGVALVGGNVSGSIADLVVDVTLLGQGDVLLRRSGAEPGDLIVTTGHLGAAAAGLSLLAQGARLFEDGLLETPGLWTESSSEAVEHCLRAALDPAPPLALGRTLSEHPEAHAGIDLSDGLSADLLRLCEESEVRARIDATAVAVDPFAAGLARARGVDALQLALHGGEDYQLLLAVPPDRYQALCDLAQVWELQITRIGEFFEGSPGVSLLAGQVERPLESRAWEHLRRSRGANGFPG